MRPLSLRKKMEEQEKKAVSHSFLVIGL